MKKKKSIKRMLIGLSVIPVIFVGVALMFISGHSLWKGMSGEISHSLAIAANSLYNTYSIVAPGDYELKDGVLMKGEQVLEGDYAIVDALKESYGMEITLFYGDERRLTTITDTAGNRLVGTKADPQTVKWVLENGRKYFAQNVEINGEDYFGYYIPVLNKDKSVVGMAFAGKARAEVLKSIWANIMSSLLICLPVIIATLLICVVSSRKIVDALKSIMEYLGDVAQSDFSHKMPKHVTKRADEIGDMGRYAVEVSHSLEEMIMTDPLTKLLNRRACKKYLDKWIETCKKQQKNKITVVIADIDHFKKINDTYGHDCGDMVLVTVSEMFKKHMKENGRAARWGGEEFLLVYETDTQSMQEAFCGLLKEIREHEFVYKQHVFHITMTAGVNGEIVGSTFDEIIDRADECLYGGKNGGRDRVVFTTGKVIELS